MGLPRSRRSVLQLLSGAASVFTAGCFDWLLRTATDSRERSISESTPEHSKASFEAYVERMRERHGNHGVWGIDKSRKPQGGTRLSFVGAWSGEWTLQKGGQSGLRIPIDYALVLYRVRGRTRTDGDRPVHRLWLWTAARPEQSDENHGNTTLNGLSIGIALNGGGIRQYAPETPLKPNDAPVQIGLANSAAPTARRPIPAGRLRPTPETTTGSDGQYAVEWAGTYGPTISVAGVCEIQRTDRPYEFTLTSEADGAQGTL